MRQFALRPEPSSSRSARPDVGVRRPRAAPAMLDLQATAGNAAVASLIAGVPVQRARRSRAARAARAADALLSDLLARSPDEAIAAIDAIRDPKRLRALQETLRTRPASSDAFETARRLLIINRIALRETQLAVRAHVNRLLRTIMRPRRKGGLTPTHQEQLQLLLEPLSDQDLKEIERDLILWPTYPDVGRMSDTIEVVTERAGRGDEAAGDRGRFPLEAAEGEEGAETGTPSTIAEEVMAESRRFAKKPGNLCLNFVVAASEVILGGEQDRFEAATRSYFKGAAKRSKETSRGARTLGRLASELRLQGLAGPVKILRWTGSRASGEHRPRPADAFSSLARSGPGWYFFVVNQFSYHTFVVSVRVAEDGSHTYFHIDDNGTEEMDATALNLELDRGLDPDHGRSVGSKFWQLYRTAAS
jgi:hypothetical protein